MSIRKTALIALCLLSPGVAKATPVFFTCTGTQTDFSSGPSPYGYRPGDKIGDEKIIRTEEITLTVTIDPDAHTFGWTLFPLPINDPPCKFLKNGKIETPPLSCSYSGSSDLLYGFGNVTFPNDEFRDEIRGTIDRTTGVLKAVRTHGTEAEATLLGQRSHVEWQMICSPARQKF